MIDSELSKNQLIQVKPYGLTPSLGEDRPVLIFKSDDEKTSMAVPLSHLDAGISVAQSKGAGNMPSPHKLALRFMEKLGYEVDFLLFKEVKGHHVFVEVVFTSEKESEDKKPETVKLSARADEAISFCLQARCDFFVSKEVLSRLRDLEAKPQMSDQPPVKSFGFEFRKTPYLM